MESLRPSRPKIPETPCDQVLLGDCREILERLPQELADLIYLDPPYFTQKTHHLTTRDRAKTFSFADLWKSHEEYAGFLYERIQLCHIVLKSKGSLFFHCDRNAIHIARAVLDDVFGAENFRSEIVWTYRRWSNSKNGLLPSHQNILFYTKSNDYTFNQLFTEYSPSTNVEQILQQRARDEHGKSVYRRDESGLVVSNGIKRGVPLGDVWGIPYLNPKAKERVGYPTQKPIFLLERIIQMSSNPDDMVLDPFCGSGTTVVAAKLLGRRFIGIDIASDACELARSRLDDPIKSESALLENGRDTYKNANSNLLQLLTGCDFVPVQRNHGIDAIVNAVGANAIALVRIQRHHESVADAAASLIKAAREKNAALLIVVKTHVQAMLFGEDVPPDEVVVIDSVACSIASAIRNTLSEAARKL